MTEGDDREAPGRETDYMDPNLVEMRRAIGELRQQVGRIEQRLQWAIGAGIILVVLVAKEYFPWL